MMNKAQYIQQAKNFAKEEVKKSFNSVTEQVTGNETQSQLPAVEAASPADVNTGANVEKIRQEEAAKMAQLKIMLEQEMQRARKMREQNNQDYAQNIDQQMSAGEPTEEEKAKQAVVEMPQSVQKGARGPAGPQSKKGTRETGKMKG